MILGKVKILYEKKKIYVKKRKYSVDLLDESVF